MSDYSDSSGDGTSTYAQIVVPSYTLEGTVVSTSTTTTGSSFVRLGSFPSLTNSSDQPSGFSNSLALAKLVGDATGLATAEASDDAEPGALLEDNDYAGDSQYYLLGFADDTRWRSSDDTIYVDWMQVADSTTVRKAETARLLTKGGWWDHSDGNRISTTCGDKVEVIQGNYKLVVLGRQQPSSTDGTAAVVDMSGGHLVDQDAAPNANVMCVEYVQSEGVWTCLEDNGTGNLTSKFHGKQKEIFTGSLLESYVGSEPTDADGKIKTPDDSNDPVVREKTWAQRIETYVGSGAKPVPSITEIVFAGAMNEVRTAGEVTSTTTAAVVADTVVGIKLDVVVGPTFEIGIQKLQFLNGKNVYASETNEAALIQNELSAINNRIYNAATSLVKNQVKLAAEVYALEGEVTQVSGDVTQLRETTTRIGGMVTDLWEEVFIG